MIFSKRQHQNCYTKFATIRKWPLARLFPSLFIIQKYHFGENYYLILEIIIIINPLTNGGSGDQGVTTPQNTEYQGFMILGLYRPNGWPRTIGMRGMRHLPIQGEDVPYLIFENNYVVLSKCRRHLCILKRTKFGQ